MLVKLIDTNGHPVFIRPEAVAGISVHSVQSGNTPAVSAVLVGGQNIRIPGLPDGVLALIDAAIEAAEEALEKNPKRGKKAAG